MSCFALSLVAKPIFQSTYFIASLIPLTIVGSLSLHLIHKNIIRYVVISLILAFSFIRLGLWYQGNTQYKWVITNRTDDFRSAEKFVIDHAYPDDTAVFYGYFARAPFEIYSKENIQITELTKAPYAGGGGAELPDPDNKIIDSLAKKHVWLITNRNRGDLFNRASQFSKLEKQLLKTHTLGLKKQFFGVGVEELIIK